MVHRTWALQTRPTVTTAAVAIAIDVDVTAQLTAICLSERGQSFGTIETYKALLVL